MWATDPDNVNQTIQILFFIAEEIGGMIDVLELLNEPAGFTSSQWAATIRQFWQDAYSAVRSVSNPQMKIMIGDAFLGVQSWEDFLTYPSAQGVMMDYVSRRLPSAIYCYGLLTDALISTSTKSLVWKNFSVVKMNT